MPYITQEKRKEMETSLFPLLEYVKTTDKLVAGDLNYLYSMISKVFFERKKSYQTANDIVGALEGAKVEFQRRILAPYEDGAISRNGDMYEM